ncbi:MAG: sortase [Clostridiales bacterium]|nr:sortase [Clostridiales bacterium]
MSRRDMGEADRQKRKRINTVLIIISGVLLIAGVIFLLIEPYKAWKRSQITGDAMNIIQSEMSAGNTEITMVVPKDGNEVPGESVDYYGDAELIIESETTQAQAGGGSGSDEEVVLNCIGYLTIDAIGQEMPVWDVATKVSLRYGVGLYEYSVVPGQNGNSTILGHHFKNGTAFAKINKLQAGDQVIFTATDGTVYVFVVESSLVIPKEDLINYIDASVSDVPQLTLVTCAYENGQSTLRQLVICKLAQ